MSQDFGSKNLIQSRIDLDAADVPAPWVQDADSPLGYIVYWEAGRRYSEWNGNVETVGDVAAVINFGPGAGTGWVAAPGPAATGQYAPVVGRTNGGALTFCTAHQRAGGFFRILPDTIIPTGVEKIWVSTLRFEVLPV